MENQEKLIIKLHKIKQEIQRLKKKQKNKKKQLNDCITSFTKLIKTPANNNMVMAWKSKGLSNESIKPPAKSDNSLNPRLK